MKAKYENDPGQGAGYGLFRLEEPGQFLSAAGSAPQYAILRSSDHKSLHPHGWEDSECRLEPDEVREDGAALLLFIGPDTVRQLDELNTYRFVLHLGGQAHKASLELAGIVYPPENERGAVGMVPPEAKPLVKNKTKPAPVPEPEPKAAPLVEAQPAPQAETLAFGPAPTETKSSRLPLILALLVGLVAAAAAVWFFVLREKTPQITTPPQSTQQEKAAPEQKPVPEADASQKKPEEKPATPAEQPAAPAEKPALPAEQPARPSTPAGPSASSDPSSSGPSTQASQPVLVQPPLERARKLLREGGKPAEALQLAKELGTASPTGSTTGAAANASAATGEAAGPAATTNRDAAFLLLEVAAEGGEAEAMLGLAAFYDPADAAPKGSILPDAEQAWLWYGKAEQAGQADAKSRKAALRAKVEQDAAAGKADAQALLTKLN